MLVVESKVHVEGISGGQVTKFLLSCSDPAYQAWWPGTHRELHRLAVSPRADHVGDVVLMDEMVGDRHLRMTGVVAEAVPGRRIVWRLGRRFRLPVRLTLELTDRGDGVDLRHTITAGWGGILRLVDPVFRLYFTRRFAAAMDAHVRSEFPRLRDLLAAPPAPDVESPGSR